ncbi:UNKNOWN [Stylonychia lemnae]|uniref:Uncharacterized protein n=1 Tax=Stylonychia lemnae TaxID=5949 RepID=A0A077ZZM4_STYLE|nr:UNKNOWN [Stylonychia lemnae]|eukprot:CDW75335.1 UNKNOWN [Stylonychia lemnae]
MFSQSPQESQHYTRLYSCKHFRNRVIRLQTLCMDTFHDEEMKKLQNWLLYGMSSSDINGSTLSDSFADSFFVISKDSFQAFTNSQGFKEISNLVTLLTNCNVYTITKSDENDSERQEVIKVSKFYEMVYDKKAIGMPVRKLTINDYVASEQQLIEKWPLIQAYALDIVGEGFFTMKHHFVNLRDELQTMYAEYDSFAIFRIVYDEIDRFNKHYYDNFFAFNKDTPLKRLERTEQDLIEAFYLRSEFSLLTRKASHCSQLADDGLPLTRALIGINTNKDYKELANKDERLYKYNLVDQKDSALHFTFEFTEKNTNIRFARTSFLSNLSQHYMEGIYFTDDEEERKCNPNGKINELNTKILFNAYMTLILTFKNVTDQFMRHQLSVEEAHHTSVAQFSKLFLQRCNEGDIHKLLKNGKNDFELVIKAFNTFGEEVPHTSTERKLINIRIQVKNIMSNADGSNLGSVIYADTFFTIDKDTYINISKHTPNLEFWYTTNKHYENLPQEIKTEKNLQCEKLGSRLNYFQDLHGFIEVKEPFNEFIQDVNLFGKLVFYEQGFIFVDQKLNCFVVTYPEVETVNFYVQDGFWVEFKTRSQVGLPANMICQDKLYLKINKAIFDEKHKYFITLAEQTYPETMKVEKIYAEPEFIKNSQSFKNFELNKKYNKFYSSNFQNFQFMEPIYRELLEFQTIEEFNVIRGKDFINFSSFRKVFKEGQSQIPYGNYGQMLIDKMKQQVTNSQGQPKTNVIIISGIPGSGKGKLAEYLAKQFSNEGLGAVTFKMPTVQESIKFVTPKYIQSMINFKTTIPSSKIILSVLPSYNHLKKIIFELKKSQEYSELFEIKYIITKVHARNFYMSKNRNTFQYLIENCMKGVTQAVIFERSNVNPNELQIMQRSLENANFETNVLPTQGRSFKLDDLGKILLNNHDKLNILYNKYFYGFEKEGKSAYFQEKNVVGGYFQYRYPFKEDLLSKTIMMALNIPINNPNQILQLLPQNEEERQKETENKENILKKQMESMSREEKRKVEREIKKQKKIEADLEPERLLKEEMDLTKRRVNSTDLYIERIRGYVLVEGKEDEQDYELICNFNELSLKPLKNQSNRLKPEELGLLIYGRNLNEGMIKEVMKTCRVQFHKKKNLKTRETITEEEIEKLKDEFVSQMLPDGWFYNGYFYLHYDGRQSFTHPNLEAIIKQYLDEQNGEIGDYNRDLQKQQRNDLKKYENQA